MGIGLGLPMVRVLHCSLACGWHADIYPPVLRSPLGAIMYGMRSVLMLLLSSEQLCACPCLAMPATGGVGLFFA